ncbi:hypothetical protein EPN28_02460, partial [Patescibacteria group bacterium]
MNRKPEGGITPVVQTIEKTEKAERAPEGWMTNNGVAKSFNVSSYLIESTANSYRDSHPEWFKIYLGNRQNKHEYLHPNLINLIREYLNKRVPQPPNGWFTNFGLERELKAGRKIINNLANAYRNSHPEWFKTYLDKSNKPTEHYHPNLIDLIKLTLSNRGTTAPDDWKTNNGLAEILDISNSSIKLLAAPHRHSHPEWFQMYLEKSSKSAREHFHPDLINLIKRNIEERELAPEGWMTNREVAKEMNTGCKTIADMADHYRSSHPEWFKIYLDKAHKPNEHFHPDLINLIKRNIEERGELAPEGWMTNGGVAVLLGVSWNFVRSLAQIHRRYHPEWFKIYLDKKARPSEHYHHDLINLIKQKADERGEIAPEGWMTNGGLAKEMNTGFKTIAGMADYYRSSHPEWFKIYLNKEGKNQYEHYHPNLVDLIKKTV